MDRSVNLIFNHATENYTKLQGPQKLNFFC